MPKERRRRRRDPNKPKRGKSAFLLFSQYTRPIVVSENPSLKFSEVAKEVARRWKEVDPVVKEELEKKAVIDRNRYAEEMKHYEAPPDLEDDGRRRRRRQKKEGPKRNVSSFMWFCKHNRATMKTANPDAKMTDISTLLGQKWNSMGAEDRVMFEELAASDKERYLRESKAYQETKAKAMAEIAAKQAAEESHPGYDEVATATAAHYATEAAPAAVESYVW